MRHPWTSSDSLQQIISRRVIDRQWFPVANRAGFHVTRPDSHWFLEAIHPFRSFQQATVVFTADDKAQAGLGEGRAGRLASGSDYGQGLTTPATTITRCWEDLSALDSSLPERGNALSTAGEDDVRQAFAEAREGLPVVLAFTNHDYDIGPTWTRCVASLPGHAGLSRHALPLLRSRTGDARGQLQSETACSLEVSLRPSSETTHVLEVWSEVPTFGPGWRSRPTPVPIITTTSTSTSRSANGAMCSTEETFPIAALDLSARPPATPLEIQRWC